jgi:hypothetical protein
MSTSRNTDLRPDDRLVTALSHWLARHVDDDELRSTVAAVDTARLSAGQAEAVEELRAELDEPGAARGDLEMVVRETLEAVALG